jgi:hypothetical protein
MYRHTRVRQYKSIVISLALLLCSGLASAQITIGDNLSLRMNGSLGYGYAGAFGSDASSRHSQGFGANADVDGSYFNPDFLNFRIRPYFNRAQSNSESQNITRGTGFFSSLGLFGGSHFPGSVSYGIDHSDNSEFYIAGIPSVVGNSSGRSFGVSWSELLPNYPKVFINYQQNTSSATVLSTDEKSHTNGKFLDINSQYRLAGWELSAFFNRNSNSFSSPDFITGTSLDFSGSGSNYGANAQHALPLHGGIGLGISHSTYGSQGYDGSGTIYTETAGVNPFRKLSINEQFNYTTNTTAALYQTTVTGGGFPLLLPERDSTGLFFRTSATYSVYRGLTVTGYFTHRQSTFNDRDYSDNQYGGTIGFNHQSRFLGFLTFSVGVVDTANKEGNSGLGLVGTVSANKRIGNWETSADFAYYQSVQTLYSIATSSSYSYGGSLRRKINPQTHWAASYRGGHSGLTVIDGNSNKSDSAATYLAWKRYSLGANYSVSSGYAVLTSTGQVVATPLAPAISGYNYVFNAKSLGVNASTMIRRVILNGGYTKISSDTKAGGFGVITNGDRYFANAIYQLRRFELQGGYSRINQDVSSIPGGPRNINTYYITLSRWFNVF